MAKKFGKDTSLKSKYRVNDDIHFRGNVRIVGEGFETKVVPMLEARKIAESMELDIVEINSKSDIPVMRICDYGKMLYEVKKNLKKNKQSSSQLKEVQLRVNIAKHDLETKANNARRFLSEGHKVKVVLTMKGREMVRREDNKKAIYEFMVMLEDVAKSESMPRDEGNKTVVILTRKNV